MTGADGSGSGLPGGTRIWFWGILALAIALRAIAFDPFAMHHPDEVLQYIEPAYRLLTGEGIVTWEYRYGMRSWLLPMLLAGPMALAKALGGSAFAGIVAARIVVSAMGLIPVVAGWHLGRRLSPVHGIVAMTVMAVWFEQVVFSTHLLTESLATAIFLGAAAIIDEAADRKRVMAGGALLALAVIFRFHYAVAAGIFLILTFRLDWKRWGWLILGAVPVVALSGIVDLTMGQWPFQWVWTNYQLNVVEGRASLFGVEAPSYYLKTIGALWGLWAVPIAVVAMLAGKSYRPLLLAALFNLAVHSLIPHKEYRFIELTIATVILLAGIGSVNAWRWIENRRGSAFPAVPALASLLLAWAGLSAWLGRSSPLEQWHGQRSIGQELAYKAGRDPRVCGIATYTAEYWQLSRAYLGRPMPIILVDKFKRPEAEPAGPSSWLASVNAVVAPPGMQPALPGYSVIQCKGREPHTRCLFIRPGACTPTPEAEQMQIEKMLVRRDS